MLLLVCCISAAAKWKSTRHPVGHDNLQVEVHAEQQVQLRCGEQAPARAGMRACVHVCVYEGEVRQKGVGALEHSDYGHVFGVHALMPLSMNDNHAPALLDLRSVCACMRNKMTSFQSRMLNIDKKNQQAATAKKRARAPGVPSLCLCQFQLHHTNKNSHGEGLA